MPVLWPITLMDKVLQAGFDHAFGATAIETAMDVGRPKKRSRFTEGIDTFSCSIDFDRTEYTTFEAFFKTTTNGGVISFYFNHPITGVQREFEFITEPRMVTLGGTYFRTSMAWRLLP